MRRARNPVLDPVARPHRAPAPRALRLLVAIAATAPLWGAPIAAWAGAGDIRTVAGGLGAGSATDVSMRPLGLEVAGSTVYVADSRNNVLRAIDVADGTVRIVAGNGGNRRIGDGGPAALAEIDGPNDVAVAADGSLLISSAYIVWKVDPSGIATIIAGARGAPSGDAGDGGLPTKARFKQITSVAVDPAGNVYLADRGAFRVRRIDAVSGKIEAFAGTGAPGSGGDGGPALLATMSSPEGIATDLAGNVYIADGGSNNRVRKVDASTGTITTLATIPGLLTRLDVDAAGNVFVAERTNDRIYKVLPDGTTSVVGTLPSGSLAATYGIAVDDAGILYVAGYSQNRVWRIDTAQVVTPFAGNGLASFGGDGGQADLAQLAYPLAMAFDATGSLVFADSDNQRIRRVDRITQVITTIAGTGQSGFAGDGGLATQAELATPSAIVASPTGDLFVADSANYRIRKIDTSGTITTIAGTGTPGNTGNGGPATSATIGYVRAMALGTDGQLYFGGDARVRKIDLATGIVTHVAGNGVSGQNMGDGGPAATAQLSVASLAVDSAGNLFVGAAHAVRRIDGATQIIERVAGTGSGSGDPGDGGDPLDAALPGNVAALAVDPTGNFIYLAAQNRVRRVDLAADRITGFAGALECCGFGGDGGAAGAALLGNVGGLLLDTAGGLLIADAGNGRIRKVEVPVCGDGTLTPPTELCDDGGTQDGDFFCDSSCRLEPQTVADTVGPGGTVRTGTDATAASPFVTAVTMPDGGEVSITQSATATGTTGFSVLGVLVDIVVTPSVPPAPATPITMEFTIDAALVPSTEDESTIQVVKDGVPITAACDPVTEATPGPTCVAQRSRLLNGDIRILVNTLSASDWSFEVTCGPEPLEGCFTAGATGKASLTIKNDPLGYAKDSLLWTLAKGEEVQLDAFGDPLLDTGYTLCVYHAGGLQLRAEIPAGGTCGTRPCWKPTATGFGYGDRQRTPNGVEKLKLVAGAEKKSMVQVKASGPNLLVPRLPLNPPLTVQLRATNGSCWSSTFTSLRRAAKPNEQLKATAP